MPLSGRIGEHDQHREMGRWSIVDRVSLVGSNIATDSTQDKIESEIESSLHAEVQSTRADLRLGGLSVRELLSRVWKSANEDSIFNRSAELGYYFLFALFPALIFLSSMFGMVATAQERARLELMLYLQRVLPLSAYNTVHKAFLSVTNADNERTLIFGLLIALWSATYGMSAAQNVLNAIYRVGESRPYWKAKLIAMLLTLAVFVLVFLAMMLLVLGDYLLEIVRSEFLVGAGYGIANVSAGISIGWRVFQFCGALILLVLVFAMTYRWAPNRKGCRWEWITPGSIVGIAGWLVVSIGFRIYLRYFNHYAITYGSFGAVIILMTWFYISGLMLLLGAEINANIERARAEQRPHLKTAANPPESPAPKR